MQAAALKESLTTLDDMLHDFLNDNESNVELTDNVKALVEAAQRSISTARMLRSREAMNDATQVSPVDLMELSKKLNIKERWVIRHVSKRENFNASLLGAEADRLIEFGLIQVICGCASLTNLGTELNNLWKTS